MGAFFLFWSWQFNFFWKVAPFLSRSGYASNDPLISLSFSQKTSWIGQFINLFQSSVVEHIKRLVSIWDATLGWNVWFLYEIQHWVQMAGFYMKCNSELKWLISIWNTTLGWNWWFLYEIQHWVEMAGFYMKYNTGLKSLASIWNTSLGWNGWFLYEIQHWFEMAGFHMKCSTELKWLVSIWNTTLG